MEHQYDRMMDIMNGAMKMSRFMKCRVRVRSWVFTNSETKRRVWVYGFGGKA